MIGPWRLLRFILSAILWGVLLWLIVAVLWAGLPFPSFERNGDNGTDYVTSVLRSGKLLTRVYSSPTSFVVEAHHFSGFAIDYRLHVSNLTLSISGYDEPLQLVYKKPILPSKSIASQVDLIQHFKATERAGDTDGANLPWFPDGDAILLFWWIHKDIVQLPLTAEWSEESGINKLSLKATGITNDALIEISIKGKDAQTVEAKVPARLQEDNPKSLMSSSPSMTYPIRIAIIHFIAPTAIFVNEHVGTAIRLILGPIELLFFVFWFGFAITAIAVSLWRLLKGPSLETTVEWIQDRLERMNQYERLRVLQLERLRDKLDNMMDSLNGDTRAHSILQLCKEGWHPERARAIREEKEAADLEKNTSETAVEKRSSIVYIAESSTNAPLQRKK